MNCESSRNIVIFLSACRSCVYMYDTYTTGVSVRMLCGGPGLSYLRISLLAVAHSKSIAMEYKEFSFGSYYPLLVFSLVDPSLAPFFFLERERMEKQDYAEV